MVNAVKVFTLRLCISAYYIHFKRVKVKIFTAFTITTVRKAQLVNLLNCDIIIDRRIHACARAIELSVSSLTSFIQRNRNDLLLPQMMDLEQHRYE